MSYAEERIKFLAVRHWQIDRSKKEMACQNDEACEFPLIRAEMRWPSPSHGITTGQVCVLICDECGQEFYNIPDEVIDNFLNRI